MKVVFTPQARAQFLAALAFVRSDRPSAAQSLRERAAESLSRLREFPDSGRTLPEFPDLPFRDLIVPPYRFFYRVKPDTVWIVAVWHGAQLPDEPAEVERG